MPPEPLPWDRKEFFRDRKHGHDRSEPFGPGSGTRWRDSSYGGGGGGGGGSHRNNNDFSPRWGFPSDFRRPPGHGKQGGWHMYHEDYPAARSGDRFLDDNGFRPAIPRGDGRYGRFYRENRSSYGQKDWRYHWEPNHHRTILPNTPSRSHFVNEQKSVGDSPMRASNPHSESCDQSHSKEQINNKTNDVNGSNPCQKLEKDNSLGSLEWKTLKWSRSGSLTSRGSGNIHSSVSKSNGGESNDMKGDLSPKNVSPLQSPSDDAVADTPSAISSEETSSRKKPRLGWGEGLAKYEKKKVESPEENASRVANAASVCVEPASTPTSNLVDKSPKFLGFSDCSSPATPSSFACSSSPGIEDKAYVKTTDADTNNCSVSSMPDENQPEELHFSLEKLELSSISNLSSLLNELLQTSEKYPADSAFVKSSALNKLLLWKGDISKELESTETEIDSLENELKSLNSDSGTNDACPASLDSLPSDCKDGLHGDISAIPRPPSLEVGSSINMIVDETCTLPCDGAREAQAEDKDVEIDSPGTATSEFVEPLAIQKSHSVDDFTNCVSMCTDLAVLTVAVTQNFDVDTDSEKIEGLSCPVDDDQHTCHSENDNFHDAIINLNKESAARASEELCKVLSSYDARVNSLEVNRSPSEGKGLTIRDKFLRRKRFLKFKEKVIALKYRAFQHVWKEDLRLLSLKSQQMKLPKKNDLSSRTLHGGIQKKHRSSIRSRFSSPAGNLSQFPSAEIISYTGKLLSKSPAKVYRSNLKMPAMILDEKEKTMSRFVSSNGFVEDPRAIEKEKDSMNPWTVEEKEIFLKQFAIHGKDFSKIASFLDHKTTADCIQFYYKNHKSDWFVKTKKEPELKKQGMPVPNNPYLLTSGNRWKMNAASLDILGTASVIAAQADEAMEPSKLLSGKSSSKKLKVSETVFEASSGNLVPEDERETAAADVLVGICGSLSSEAMSSCVTSTVEQQKVGLSSTRPLTPEVTQNVDDGDTCSDESCGELDPVDWTDDEKSLFVQAFSSYGKDFAMISRHVRTKSRDQCKVFFSKARKCLGLDNIQPGTGEGVVPVHINSNGSGSDTEDTGIVENGSRMEDTGIVENGSRMDEDLTFVNLDVSKPEALSTEVVAVKQSVTVSDEVVGKLTDDISRDKDQPVTEDDTSKVGIPLAGVLAEVGSGVLSITKDPVGECSNKKSIVKAEGEPNVRSSPIDVGVSTNEQCQPSTTGDNSHHSSSGDSMVDLSGSSQISTSSPLDLPVKVATSTRSFQNCYMRKCSQTPSQNVVGELPFLAKSEARTNNHAGSSSSKAEKPTRNRDVKLFGKILSKPSSVDDSTPSAEQSDGTKKHPTSIGNKIDINLAVDHDTDDHNNFMGLENVPIRSYGFWDGTKIQTGFPSLPDSALLLAKYSSAFSSYPATVNVDQCNLNGACVFSPREFSNSNGNIIDYSVNSTQEVVQPFSLDLNPRQETLTPEVPRNRFDVMPGIRQVKLNVVQGGDISDPVAALKLHYGRAQQYGAGSGGNGIIGE